MPRLRLLSSAAITPVQRHYRGHVLIVDADVVGRTGLANFLRRRGLRVWVAGRVGDALAMMAHCTPDVMLISLGLPALGGFDLIRRVREQHITAMLPIFVLSASAQAREIRLALALGADDFLAAPLELSLTEGRIIAFLRRQVRTRLHLVAPEATGECATPSMHE
jgi:two-component system OmpR family response regulator